MNTPLRPLLVYADGHLAGYRLQNPKAYAKSIETRELWVVHPATLRVLAVPGTQGVRLSEGGEHYRADLPAGALLPPEDLGPAAAAGETDLAALETSADESGPVLARLAAVIHERNLKRPEGSYTTQLFTKGEGKIRKKTGEEAVELLLAQNDGELVYEAADLLYHMTVLFEVKGLSWDQVMAELKQRMG